MCARALVCICNFILISINKLYNIFIAWKYMTHLISYYIFIQTRSLACARAHTHTHTHTHTFKYIYVCYEKCRLFSTNILLCIGFIYTYVRIIYMVILYFRASLTVSSKIRSISNYTQDFYGDAQNLCNVCLLYTSRCV